MTFSSRDPDPQVDVCVERDGRHPHVIEVGTSHSERTSRRRDLEAIEDLEHLVGVKELIAPNVI
ncbi:hypothetical protein ACYCVF_33780 [Bradyrhizobium sp. 1.29L]